MQETIKILIYIHAFFGGIGLITGLISVFVKKGGINHRKSGKIFSFSMIFSSLISLLVARLPQHENHFLFLIGVFTIYMVLVGNRALNLKSKPKANWVDYALSGSMFIISIFMMGIGIYYIQKDQYILYAFFGAIGSFLSLNDFKTYRNFKENKNAWLKSHIGKMVGALIASITAFLVAGLHIGTTMVWILPTIIGTAYIIFQTRKYK